MSHNLLIRNPVSTWTGTILSSEFTALDAQLSAGVNGDEGGCSAPATVINLGGAGMAVTGPLVIARGGQAYAAAPGVFQLQDGDYPQLGPYHVGRTRQVVYPCLAGRPMQKPGWFPRWVDCGMQSLAPTLDLSDGNGPLPARLVVPFRAHDGATLSSITLNWRIASPHTQLPSKTPSARVVRANAAGQLTPLTSVAAGADSNGFIFSPKANTVATWVGQQTITLPCDQDNVVDVGTYTYYVEIVEEQGISGWPWLLIVKQPVLAMEMQLLGTLTSGLISIDGVTLVEGSRVLVQGLGTATGPFNGIWTAHAGQWTRAADFQAATDYTQGVIIPVQQGANFGGSYWQGVQASWTLGTTPIGTLTWGSGSTPSPIPVGFQVVPSAPNGFWYQCVGAMGPVVATNATFPPPYQSITIASSLVPAQAIEIDITSVGLVGIAQFSWKLGGVVQGANLLTAPSVSLAAGITVLFSAGAYFANTVYVTNPTTGGIPGLLEPSWPTTVGATIVSGNLIFQCMGATQSPLSFVSRGPDDALTSRNVGTELLPYGNIFQSFTATYTNITQAAFD